MEYTPNMKLILQGRKPEKVSLDSLNGNFTTIDTVIGDLQNAVLETEEDIEKLPTLYQSKTELLYDANEGLKEITGDFSKYAYLKVALTTDNSYWSYYDINKSLTAVPIVRVTGGSFYFGRINFTSSDTKISVSDFSGFILSEGGITAATDLNVTIRRVYGIY